jgi:hypothetical protein
MSELRPTPKRALSTNFTGRTLHRSILAKKRLVRKRQLKELFLMKNTNFLKQPMGALIAVAIVIAGSIGVYAAMNWFNGDVKVASDHSIMTVDLAQCQSVSLPGFEPNVKKVQFKILNEQHISSEALRETLLAQCEFDAVRAKYDATTVRFQPSVVKAITPYRVTLETFWNGQYTDGIFNIGKDTEFYDKGNPASRADISVSDTVVFVYDITGPLVEGQNPIDSITTVKSIFKTQYDTKKAASMQKGFYEDNNIMPLDMYNSQKH